jgi:hypothetical protein
VVGQIRHEKRNLFDKRIPWPLPGRKGTRKDGKPATEADPTVRRKAVIGFNRVVIWQNSRAGEIDMDIVRQKQIREWSLLGLVGTMALVANLPRHILDQFQVEPGLLMALLGLMVVFALFLYVRFFFFLLYALLAVGANLPEKWAESLGISQTPMLIALVAMVVLGLINYSAKALPSGLEPKRRRSNPEATRVLLEAIERRNMPYIKTLLTMDFDIDEGGAEGFTPLMRAAQRGEFKLVQMLIKRGASALVDGPSGRASECALINNFPQVTEFLRKVEEVQRAEAAKQAAKQGADASPVVA